jgi:Domain of unknown function (DUF5666)
LTRYYCLPKLTFIMPVMLVGVMLSPQISFAQAAEVVRVRGQVVSLNGATLTVKSRTGEDVAVQLADKWAVGGVVKASMADIKPGVFVGTAAVPQNGTSLHALEVVVFPDSMRGTGEGSYAWDLKPQSSMTNANITNAVDSVDGRTVTLAYKGGTKSVVIGADTPIVTFGAADRSDIKPGANVFVAAQKQADGTLVATRVAVGKDGLVPPM